MHTTWVPAVTDFTPAVEDRLRAVIDMIDVAECAAHLDGAVPDSLVTTVMHLFDKFVFGFDEVTRGMAPIDAARIGTRLQAMILPLMERTENAYRWLAKPRGYAGDYLTISQMYDDEARGDGAVGMLIDRCFMRMPAVRAVQHRRSIITNEIRATIRTCHDRPARVTSLACGPARELFDLYPELDESRSLLSTLVDFDRAALDHCRTTAHLLELGEAMRLVEANLIHVALGRRPLELADQDLVYSIGLIDYLTDDLVVKLFDFIHGALAPGGRVIVGNFHPRNPTKAVMDHILDWKLVHRTEADLDRLFRASAFGAKSTRCFYEPMRVNLFVENVKA